MKVLVAISQFYQISGSEKLSLQLARGLSQKGYKVDLLCFSQKCKHKDSAELRKLEDIGVNVIFLELEPHPTLCSVIKVFFKLLRLMKSVKYEFVESSYATLAVLLLLSRFFIKGPDLVFGVHAVYSFEKLVPRNIQVLRMMIRFFGGVKCYAISNAVSTAFKSFIGSPSLPIITISNAIEDDFYSYSSACFHKENTSPAKLLFVGSILRYKGIDILFESLANLLDRRVVELYIVGERGKVDALTGDDSSFLLDIDKEISDRGWSSIVHWLGNRNDVKDLMQSSDILVHPTRIEGFGLVIAEAMASGLLIASTKVGGIPEVVSGTDVNLVSANSPKEFEIEVIRLLSLKAEERTKYIHSVQNKAQKFRSDYRIDKFISNYILSKK